MNKFTRKIVGYFFPSFELSVDEQRARAEKMARFMRLPKGMTCQPMDAGGVPGEWFIPDVVQEGLILYLHGGAYSLGSVNTYREMLSRLTLAAGVRLLAVDYRRAPEYPYPAAVEDAVASYLWLLEQGHAPQQIVLIGDSAGGGLTLAALLALRDSGHPLPAGAVCISSWTDLALTGNSVQGNKDVDVVLDAKSLAGFAAAYAGGEALTTPLLSPFYADLSGLPPLLIQVGTEEILLADSRRLADRAEAAGVDVDLQVWDGMFHMFHMFPFFRETREAMAGIGAFVRGRITDARPHTSFS